MPQVLNIGVPAPDATELTRLQRAYTQAVRDAEQLIYGHGDFTESDSSQLETWKSTKYWDARRLIALSDHADPLSPQPHHVLGVAIVNCPLRENRELAYVWLWVTPPARGAGVGRALAAQVRRELANASRTTVQVWRTGPIVAQDHPRAVLPATGFGAVDGAAPEVRWLTSLGFEFEQVERVSTLTIPSRSVVSDDDAAGVRGAGGRAEVGSGVGNGEAREVGEREDWLAAVGELRQEARGKAAGYRIVAWEGPCPEGYREGFAQLKRRMSVDAPSAGLTAEESDMTAERVAYNDERALARGLQWLVVAAQHEESGALVAYTEVQWLQPGWPGIWQEDTLVHGEHRGRRLGMWIKTEMLFRLLEANPAAERIHTWNADENGYMLAINDALGFRPVAYESAWELREG